MGIKFESKGKRFENGEMKEFALNYEFCYYDQTGRPAINCAVEENGEKIWNVISFNNLLEATNQSLTHVKVGSEHFWMLLPLFDAGIIRVTEETTRITRDYSYAWRNLMVVEVDQKYVMRPGDECLDEDDEDVPGEKVEEETANPEIFNEESGRKYVKLMACKPTWPEKGEVEVEVTYYFDAYVRGNAPFISMKEPDQKYESYLTMQFDDVSDSNRTVVTSHPPATWCLQPLFDAGIIKKVEGVTRPWGYLVEVDEKYKFVSRVAEEQEDEPDEDIVEEEVDDTVDSVAGDEVFEDDDESAEVFENKDACNFCIRSLKETVEAALAVHPEWRNAGVIIYREASESANAACEARIVTEDDASPYDGNENIEDAIDSDGSALVLVDWRFPDTKGRPDPITVGELMDVLSQENINLDAKVLCHFEAKDLSETAYAARFVTCYGMAPYEKGYDIQNAIKEDGVVLVISDWQFPEDWEEDEDDE